jgi:hypothetical protein
LHSLQDDLYGSDLYNGDTSTNGHFRRINRHFQSWGRHRDGLRQERGPDQRSRINRCAGTIFIHQAMAISDAISSKGRQSLPALCTPPPLAQANVGHIDKATADFRAVVREIAETADPVAKVRLSTFSIHRLAYTLRLPFDFKREPYNQIDICSKYSSAYTSRLH